jgi:hypothetical protein
MADVKTISGVPEHMLNILYQRASSVWIGDYVWVMEQDVMAVPCGDEEIMLC